MNQIKDVAPIGATHYGIIGGYDTSGGYTNLRVRWYKQTGKTLYIYITDNDNEYPQWSSRDIPNDIIDQLLPIG